MLAVKTEKKENKMRAAIEYIGEYKGVKAIAIFDKEGLVVDHLGKNEFDAEKFSSLARLMLDGINGVLNRLNENPATSVWVKTPECWLALTRIGDLILAVNADIETDDLIRLRIGQAAEMIKSHINEKYPLLYK